MSSLDYQKNHRKRVVQKVLNTLNSNKNKRNLKDAVFKEEEVNHQIIKL